MVPNDPLSWPHLVTPKDIATKNWKTCPDDSSTIVQNVRVPSQRYLSRNKKNIHTADLISNKTHTNVVALRLTDNKAYMMVRVVISAACAKRSHCRYCFYSVVQKWVTRCPVKREIRHGGALRSPAKFHVYRGKSVGTQPPKLKIANFGHKFAPRGSLVCTIFTKFSVFVLVQVDFNFLVWSLSGDND